MIIEKIERSIEYYAEKTNEYPETVRMNEKTYERLKKEIIKEYLKINEECKDLTKIRGCQVVIDSNMDDTRIKVGYKIYN